MADENESVFQLLTDTNSRTVCRDTVFATDLQFSFAKSSEF